MGPLARSVGEAAPIEASGDAKHHRGGRRAPRAHLPDGISHAEQTGMRRSALGHPFSAPAVAPSRPLCPQRSRLLAPVLRCLRTGYSSPTLGLSSPNSGLSKRHAKAFPTIWLLRAVAAMVASKRIPCAGRSRPTARASALIRLRASRSSRQLGGAGTRRCDRLLFYTHSGQRTSLEREHAGIVQRALHRGARCGDIELAARRARRFQAPVWDAPGIFRGLGVTGCTPSAANTPPLQIRL